MADAQMTTDDSGGYKFDGLRAGTYSVEISGFEAGEVSFSSTSGAATVGVGETKVVTFDGTYVRTAGVQGQVSVDGEGLEGVTVTLKGDDVDRTEITNAAGQYAFSMLKSGTYQVGIINPDPEDYEFETTSKTATIATGETANVPFEGTLLRTAGIAGRVSLDDGMGLDGVTVTLAGAADATTMTANGGQYSFAGLAAGGYIVSISNPDANAYNFDDAELKKTVDLMDDQSAIVNFTGTHTRTASVSGMLFIDEVVQDKMHTAGEPSIVEAITPLVAAGALDPAVVAGLLAKAKVKLRGPDLNTMQDIDINADGSFSTGETLMAGTYQVELPVNDDDVAAGLAAAGVAFVGESMVVEVGAGGMATANFPFRITMQTISVGAVMGNREMITDPPLPVSDVELELYPTAEDAADGTNMFGAAMKTGEMGMAVFSFARADDTNPAGEATDNLVFVKVVGHHDDLSVSDNPIIEVEYAGIKRVHVAPAHVRLLNTAVRFQFWVKSDADARDGDMPLAGWHTTVTMGDSEEALMKPDPEDATKMVNLTDPTEGDEEDGEELGRAMVSYAADPAMLPATFAVAVRPDNTDATDDIEDWQQPMAMGETWEEVGDDRLMYTHTGFELPALNTHKMNDLGPTYVTFKTQKLTVGAYREADDEPGFSDFQSRVAHGDHRPAAGVALSASVMVEASFRRGLEVYDEWDHDGDAETDPIEATLALKGGMATFGNLPADMDFTVQFDAGSDRVAVGGPDSRSDRVQAFGDDLELGKSVGAFGDMSGAGPEVKLCPLTTDMRPSSLKDDASDCATFAYQWNTGAVTGALNKAVKDLAVDVEAETDEHSEAPRDTKTDKDGAFGFSGVQDGVYTITVSDATGNYKFAPDRIRLAVYHDEYTDDKDADTKFVGTRGGGHAAFSATKLRLSIKGYVANVSHETNDVVRVDETAEGAMLDLYKFKEYHKDTGLPVAMGGAVQTVEVQADGFYEFNDLEEGVKYFVQAQASADYEILRSGFSAKNPVVDFTGALDADVYVAIPETDESLRLPKWQYETSTVSSQNHGMTVEVSATATEKFVFYNFALLHKDGELLGRVKEARNDPEGVAVELRRCFETTLTSGNATRCVEELGFGARTENAGKTGSWSFAALREGYYVVNVAATTYSQAKYRADGTIDDDAPAGTPGGDVDDTRRTDDAYALLQGKRAFNRQRATFYVYNHTLSSDDALASIKVTGTPHTDSIDIDIAKDHWVIPTSQSAAGSDALGVAAASSDPRTITFASGSVAVDAKGGAGTAVYVGAAPQSGGTVAVPTFSTSALGYHVDAMKNRVAPGAALPVTTATVRVTAQNGYNDHDYTLNLAREAPVDNNLVAMSLNAARSRSGAAYTIRTSDLDAKCGTASGMYGPDCDEYRSTIPASTGTGATMPVFVFAWGKNLQQGMTVTIDGVMADALAPHSNDAGARVYRVDVPRTGVVNKTVAVAVTSEDGVDKVHYLTLNRSNAGAAAAVTIANASADEGDAMTFTITLDKAVNGGFTVTPSYTNGTAASTDYNANTTGIAFAGRAGETQSFTVATTEDALVEDDETFTVSLSVSNNSETVTATSTATGTIVDDDVPPPPTPTVTISDASADEGDDITFTVTLSAAVAGGLTVTPSFTGGTATEGTDYTENIAGISFVGTAGETQTFDVATTDDATEEPDETFTVSLSVSNNSETVTATSTATGTIVDNDQAPDAPTGLEVDYGDRSVTVNWDTPSPAQHGSSLITGYEVRATAANLATVTVSPVIGPTTYTHTFASGDLQVGADWTIEVVAVNAAGRSSVAMIPATPLPEVRIAVDNGTIEEAATSSTREAALSASFAGTALTRDLVITVSVDENAADVTLDGTTLTILAGNNATGQTAGQDDNITITVVDDDLDEGSEVPGAGATDPYDVVTITGMHDGRATAPAAGVEITITDDDAAPPAPGNFQAAFSNGVVSLTWDRVTTANPTVTSYEYCHGSAGACDATADPQATWHAITNSNEFTVGHNVDASGFTNGALFFQVRARNTVGAGAHATEVSVTIAN